ncbi:helix-turn-helix domain-containing protein [Lachnobacterium bovis]|uniref:helix-turn-helix domain-containing protein n=1 Tax=Lachnobacterium bovis TaxID=140626 RepID=UPI000554612F|nr:XRE family transcriptional regulator [Lachnobacterium bovis]
MYKRYVELRDAMGVRDSAVAKAIGIPQSTFSDWKKGKSSPKYEKLKKIADFFDVNVNWLSGDSDTKTILSSTSELTKEETSDNVISIPVFDSYESTDVIATFNLGITSKISRNIKGVKYHNDNMMPRILPNDILIYDNVAEVKENKLNLLIDSNNNLECYNIIKLGNGYMLESYNQIVPMRFVSYDDFEQAYKVIGTVIRSIQRH